MDIGESCSKYNRYKYKRIRTWWTFYTACLFINVFFLDNNGIWGKFQMVCNTSLRFQYRKQGSETTIVVRWMSLDNWLRWLVYLRHDILPKEGSLLLSNLPESAHLHCKAVQCKIFASKSASLTLSILYQAKGDLKISIVATPSLALTLVIITLKHNIQSNFQCVKIIIKSLFLKRQFKAWKSIINVRL